MSKQILNELLDIGGVGTKINLYSQNSKTFKGSMCGVNNHIKNLLEQGFIKKIDPCLPGKSKWREIFYRITDKGATFIGRKEDYINKSDKNPKDITHQSNVNDIALSFKRNFPDYEVSFEFEKKLPLFNKVHTFIKPDIIVRMKKDSKEYVFIVELERKKTADRILDKVELYDKLFSQLDFSKYRIPKMTKVLLIYSNRIKDISLYRHQEYNLHKDLIESLEKQIQNVLFKFSDRYLVTTFNNYHKLNEAVWYNAKGEKQLLFIKN